MRRHISQREARAAIKRVEELEELQRKQFASWVRDYPGGVHLGSFNFDKDEWFFGSIKTARRLGCAVVITYDETGKIDYYAVKPKGTA